MTPAKIAKIDPQLSNLCWKCHKKEGTIYHAWWGCTKTKNFWTMIAGAMAEELGYKLIKKHINLFVGFKNGGTKVKRYNPYLVHADSGQNHIS